MRQGPVEKLELTESAVSQHLKVLKEAGLLVGEKKVTLCTMTWTEMPANASFKIEELADIQRELAGLKVSKGVKTVMEIIRVTNLKKHMEKSRSRRHFFCVREGEVFDF